MTSLCFCCLSTRDKVHIVMSEFGKIQRLSEIESDSESPQFICGRVLPVAELLQAPISGSPCVFYEAIVEEMLEKDDQNGSIGVQDEVRRDCVWVPLYWESRSADFKIVDPSIPNVEVLVLGSSDPVRVMATEETIDRSRAKKGTKAKLSGTASKAPPHVQEFLARGNVKISPKAFEIRYREASFDYGEQLAVLGVIMPNRHDENTQAPDLVIKPVSAAALTDSYVSQKGWSSWQRNAWRDLAKEPCVLLSDMSTYFQGLDLPPLPAHTMPSSTTTTSLSGKGTNSKKNMVPTGESMKR